MKVENGREHSVLLDRKCGGFVSKARSRRVGGASLHDPMSLGDKGLIIDPFWRSFWVQRVGERNELR